MRVWLFLFCVVSFFDCLYLFLGVGEFASFGVFGCVGESVGGVVCGVRRVGVVY